MRRGSVGPGVKDNPLFPSARAPAGNSSRGRNGGLFSSSSSSSGDSDASDGENDGSQRVGAVPPLLGATVRSRSANLQSNSLSGADFRRRTMFSTSTTSLSSSVGAGDNGGHSTERKGLFENDDDGGDTLETFHERVKLRQSKKQSEMKALKVELETAQRRAEELETKLNEVNKEKDEFAIRTKECQRIIEKRNKQLMKASEKMARHSEQYELQVAELQTKLTAITAQRDHVRADAATMEETNRRERGLKEQELQRQIETQTKRHEKILQAAEVQMREQQAENTALIEKLRDMEKQLLTTAHRKPTATQVMASDEYQSLVKRCEDADAISRGLNFQLEKEQQEKKYLRKQLTALQETVGAKTAAATAASVGFFPDGLSPDPRGDGVDTRDSIATVATEAELASFDYTAGKGSAVSSPVAVAAPSPTGITSPASETSSPRRSRSRERGFSTSSFTDDASKPSLREGKRRAASAQTIKISVDLPEKSVEDKSAAANGKALGTSSTFFEKLSSRFKRGSSPRNGLSMSKPEDDSTDGATTAETGFASPLPPRQGFPHSKVLKERPRMYVAKSPSHHEDESSDSIFGSESSSSDSSDDDMPPPPPPPPIAVHEAGPPFNPPVHVDIPSQLIPSDASADADSSSSSGTDDDDDRRKWGETSDKPTRLPPTRFRDTSERRGPPRKHDMSSSSSSSDDDSDEPDVEKSQPLNVDAKKVDSMSESSSSEDDESDEEDNTVKITTEVHRKVRKTSLSGQDRHEKHVSRSHTSSKSREKSRSLSGSDNLHNTSKKERERKRKQQQARRNGKRRPASMKTVRVSQMRQQMNNKQQQKDQKEPHISSPLHPNDPPRPPKDDGVEVDGQSRRQSRRQSESKTSESETEEERQPAFGAQSTDTPPLPPEPTIADTELYMRQQARLRERHELQMKKKIEADEADAVRGDIHRRVEMWAFGKELLHMILTLDQISSNDALKKCQLMVVQSPDDDTVRKAYRNIIRVVHPDKLRGATIPEQLEAKELFTVLNQAFEKFKNQAS
ncbi:hypothetical protein PHMEG_0009911 [Phytophthora megakarya]|uniref:J domain-containing protein n=1 Tax=Phytophthora megakarya TaxID=4795 RepID=A0A225WFB5_9STRA|nr:hypothetical protein PHMEG_0009911 [Phytophthora megakarya]